MTAYHIRVFRAMKLDPQLYEEVEADPGANLQAVLTVLLSSLAAGVGGALSGGWFGVFLNTATALVGWIIWAFLSFVIGTKLLPEPETRSDMGELIRCTGFSSAPGLLQIFGFLPGVGGYLRFAVAIWMLAAFVVAVRQALDYTSTLRALGVCAIGWLVLMSLNVMVFLASFGRLGL
ncbi:MAG: YIP1 family protein [Fibrobacteria bacterium]